jgi:Raf kinase inhibitor-like YbhB/YbcL family protein
MEIKSSAFSEGDAVPTRYTCDGEDISPPLDWSGVPEGTTELRLSVTDPDAPGGTFTHWSVTGIDPSSVGVAEGSVPTGGTEQRNDFGSAAYAGPCPPRGRGSHRYLFTIEALDDVGNALGSATLTTTFGH